MFNFRKDFVILEKIVVRLAREKQRRKVKGVDEYIFPPQERFYVFDVMVDDIMAAKAVQ